MFAIRMKNNLLRLLFLTLFFLSLPSFPQSVKELKNIFIQAESHYLFEEYELANPLYLSLLAFYPDNCNLLYKIGNCYLNIPDEKVNAIEYLEKSVKNASYNSKSEQFKEKRAPLDAYFSLGRAYMINNELEKAINTFELFKKLVKESTQKEEMLNIDFVDQQIQACKNAIELINNPAKIDKSKLPDYFDQGSVNENPVISFDGNTIAFTEKRGLSNAIYYSKRENGKWQPPVEITSEINAGEDCSTCSLNNDGTELFLYKDDNKDGNIYSTTYQDGRWSPIKKLNRNINTKFFESHAAISCDGKKLYFTSNREDGTNLDIYVSEKDASGDWGPANKLPDIINTPFNEDTPFITISDTILYFASEGHYSMGGFDIFRSIRKGDSWTKPENLGYPINTTDDDRFYCPFNNGLNAYYAISTDYKKKDIFYIGYGVPAIDQIFKISGNVSLADSLSLPDESNRIFMINLITGDTVKTIFPQSGSGFYSVETPPGHFRLVYTGINYISVNIDTLLDQNTPSNVLSLNVTLQKESSPVEYEKIELEKAPRAEADTATLIKDLKVADLADENVPDSDVLYYTVQVMALKNPVDVSYFKNIPDIKVMYNDVDKFYRYTTGRFATREEALSWRAELIRKGYPNDIFVKKVLKSR